MGARNPGTIYFGNIINDWTSPQSFDRWQEEAKTLFDPCPAGWRVPKSGVEELSPWHAFSLDNSTWNGESVDPSGGRTFDRTVVYGPTTAWYPASPRRYYSSGNFQLWFCVISATSNPSAVSSALHFCYDGTSVRSADSHSRAHAHSVRCIRE